jgi:hypothetical protein
MPILGQYSAHSHKIQPLSSIMNHEISQKEIFMLYPDPRNPENFKLEIVGYS